MRMHAFICVHSAIILLQGMVVLDHKHQCDELANTCKEFEADMYIVCHDGACIKSGLQGTVYVAGTMQTAVIKEIIGKVHKLCQYL